MLRFDLPKTWSNVTRLEAFLTFAVCWFAFLLSPWLMLILVAQGFIRGFYGHYKEPAHRALDQIVRIHRGGRRVENFAPSLTLPRSLRSQGREWQRLFCAAGWVYGAWYRRFPPVA